MPTLPPDLSLSETDRALMTAALAAIEALARAQTDLWRQLATAIKATNCPAHAAKIQTDWRQKVDAINAQSNFGFHPGIALLRPD